MHTIVLCLDAARGVVDVDVECIQVRAYVFERLIVLFPSPLVDVQRWRVFYEGREWVRESRNLDE